MCRQNRIKTSPNWVAAGHPIPWSFVFYHPTLTNKWSLPRFNYPRTIGRNVELPPIKVSQLTIITSLCLVLPRFFCIISRVNTTLDGFIYLCSAVLISSKFGDVLINHWIVFFVLWNLTMSRQFFGNVNLWWTSASIAHCLLFVITLPLDNKKKMCFIIGIDIVTILL